MAKGTAQNLADTPGRRIQAAREALGLSEAELGYLVGMSPQAINDRELAGPTNYPSLPNALKLAMVLRLDPWVLAFGRDADAERGRLIDRVRHSKAGGPDLPRLDQAASNVEELRAIKADFEDSQVAEPASNRPADRLRVAEAAIDANARTLQRILELMVAAAERQGSVAVDTAARATDGKAPLGRE